jgi:hypothetical protein
VCVSFSELELYVLQTNSPVQFVIVSQIIK